MISSLVRFPTYALVQAGVIAIVSALFSVHALSLLVTCSAPQIDNYAQLLGFEIKKISEKLALGKKRRMNHDSLEMKQEHDMSPFAVDSEMKVVNGLQQEASADVRSVLIVGAGPAGLMLAYVYSL